jgi:hypothetical protein
MQKRPGGKMNRHMILIGILFVVIGVAGLLGVAYYGSTLLYTETVSTPNLTTGNGNTMMGNGASTVYTNLMRNMMTDFSKDKYSSLGERLFLSGTDETGYSLQAELDVSGFPMQTMMSRRIACANCHGVDAKGDFLFPDGTTKSADIRWSTLLSEGFDSAVFKTAVTLGKDEKGAALSAWMPRWTMTDAQLKALEEYLKTL